LSLSSYFNSVTLYAHAGWNDSPWRYWNHHPADVWNFANFNAED